MKRRYDDEEVRPNWVWRLVKGIFAGVIVSGAAAAAISIFLLPPPEPPPPPAETAEAGSGPRIVDGIEVATQPAYFGAADQQAEEGVAPSAADESAALPAEALGPVELDGPALVVNAAAFEAPPGTPPGMPLVAVVIDDTGASPMMHDSLFEVDLPLTIGVVSGGAGDTATAQAARSAGFEVVAQLPIVSPGAAEGAALEYGLPAGEAADRTALLMRRLPMAVAAARPLAAPAPPAGALLEGIMDAIGPLGFAWLEHGVAPGGADAVSASDLDAIFAVSRFAIPAGTAGADAHAILDRAGKAAAESGAAVVMAAAEEPVLLAIQLWAGGGEAILAPLSAVVRRQNGGDALPDAALSAETPEPATAEAADTGAPAN